MCSALRVSVIVFIGMIIQFSFWRQGGASWVEYHVFVSGSGLVYFVGCEKGCFCFASVSMPLRCWSLNKDLFTKTLNAT